MRGLMREPSVSGASLAASDGSSMSRRASARLIRQVTVARDRYLVYRRARRLRPRGASSSATASPLPEIELMDGPLAGKMLDDARRQPRSSRYLAAS